MLREINNCKAFDPINRHTILKGCAMPQITLELMLSVAMHIAQHTWDSALRSRRNMLLFFKRTSWAVLPNYRVSHNYPRTFSSPIKQRKIVKFVRSSFLMQTPCYQPYSDTLVLALRWQYCQQSQEMLVYAHFSSLLGALMLFVELSSSTLFCMMLGVF